MITYFYWALVIGAAFGLVFLFGAKFGRWKSAVVAMVLVLGTGWGAYVFHFQQLFVKRYGGVMTIRVPPGQRHIAATWKADNLWVENYDPRTNECIFSEYSRGSVLEGRVTIKNCNPIAREGVPPEIPAAPAEGR
ncbi:MAG: hypothetical protein OET16_00050 [Chromatiales bacterium]|jgi:hypothetical protein|nr:hypothetical protein [Chromatiales bacterium]MDH3930589.1 hypothetical protein [Chromatiales bacterium]MDH4013491.1 hypothetical protein [Chromatiales bacterium]PLX55416.1 MAG: hypothetical protein C0629_12655 [Chromatiales bacterium]